MLMFAVVKVNDQLVPKSLELGTVQPRITLHLHRYSRVFRGAGSEGRRSALRMFVKIR